jgi:hypothetical protein
MAASDIYTSTRRTRYSVLNGKKKLNAKFSFLGMDVRTDDVAKEMGTLEIEIQRMLVFDSYMMVKDGILAVLENRNPTGFKKLRTMDDMAFLRQL